MHSLSPASLMTLTITNEPLRVSVHDRTLSWAGEVLIIFYNDFLGDCSALSYPLLLMAAKGLNKLR